MPVTLVPDGWTPLQNKAEDVVLGAYTVPDEEGNVVGFALSSVVPLVRCEITHARTHPLMQAFLFQKIEVDDVHMNLLVVELYIRATTRGRFYISASVGTFG